MDILCFDKTYYVLVPSLSRTYYVPFFRHTILKLRLVCPKSNILCPKNVDSMSPYLAHTMPLFVHTMSFQVHTIYTSSYFATAPPSSRPPAQRLEAVHTSGEKDRRGKWRRTRTNLLTIPARRGEVAGGPTRACARRNDNEMSHRASETEKTHERNHIPWTPQNPESARLLTFGSARGRREPVPGHL